MSTSPEEQQQIEQIGEAIGVVIGTIVGTIIYIAILAGLAYVILHYMIGLPFTYLQVFGVILILDAIKSFFKK